MKSVFVLLFVSLIITACSDKQKSEQGAPQATGKNSAELTQDTKWVAKAKVLTTQYKLISIPINCLAFEEDDVANGKKSIDVREIHNEKCGGDPGTAPRVFSFEIDMASGEYKTDRFSIVSGGGYESMDNLSKPEE